MTDVPLLTHFTVLTAIEATAVTAFALSGLLAERAMQWPDALGLGLLGAAATATGLRALALATGYTLPQWSPGESPRD